ncbi:MAG: nucleoside diphosphate kinase regulator [Prolixibacteraceae bacterium]|jgi:regulator of nucleoside diphosphate kinase|nr:nucleoside diphosphate kinase regulator [Prolixibacteraceae bacterium]MDI9564473.1 nucleoside diphosphate kinase regulator [Bacteroidota bacterium]NLT00779.1 nucleoside diphosphate kinase regulator [Bacteroidales bacterium]OQB79763.1 MAG: Regulator of nucleoside diphosphate kinase [Bacteroidetes bacterium ADurb.Bin123]HNU78317.1 nucleoside diphosphate kinase regulator [Prolixibacteraceae bacterium]
MRTQLQITNLDYQRLFNLINSVRDTMKDDLHNIETLEQEIDRAKRIEPRKIGPDFVTMNSEVEVIDLASGRVMTFKLVYPQDADFKNNRLSVLSPLGSALIGYREGDEVEFRVPAGTKKVKITRILFQPEAKGEYAL